ncbi:uncharacterized protein B0I36DRAFT_376790 [Microdochium trichocladiopsis]|uniref:Rhodopsin domain-containing protein n=1 Tax=Microdochium trichocladiopsis TaxID=1682393 RepID=A0A9P8XXJ0_9PEZI|nr:uncharacterized protein B0I36DRAFT_376790 [Microdochium trichocladiopsis]KAH7025079.1 hypothetical protein B0I36DRAFT_376790 [Microdochium trichocladiopsis]
MDPLAPVAPPPDGVVPDFHSFTSHQLELCIIFAVTFSAATLLVGARLYTGFCLVKGSAWDALLVVISWCFSAGFFVAIVIILPAGFGRHIWDVNQEQFAAFLRMVPVLAVTYLWPPTCVKLSLAIIYYRINPNMVFRYCGHCVAAFTITPTVVYTVLLLGPCNPQKGNLQCLNSVTISQMATNISSDLLLLAMPIPMTLKLNMPKRQKLTVAALLALSSSCVVFPIIRAGYIQSWVSNVDVTYNQATVTILAILELNIGLICNSMAMLRPFVRQHMPRLGEKLFGSGVTGPSSHPSDNSNSRSRIAGRDRTQTTVTAAAGGGGGGGGGSTRVPFHERWAGRGRSDNYMLHSIGKSGMPPSDMAVLEAQQENHGKIQITSEIEVSKSGESSSERRIMYDSS